MCCDYIPVTNFVCSPEAILKSRFYFDVNLHGFSAWSTSGAASTPLSISSEYSSPVIIWLSILASQIASFWVRCKLISFWCWFHNYFQLGVLKRYAHFQANMFSTCQNPCLTRDESVDPVLRCKSENEVPPGTDHPSIPRTVWVSQGTRVFG